MEITTKIRGIIMALILVASFVSFATAAKTDFSNQYKTISEKTLSPELESAFKNSDTVKVTVYLKDAFSKNPSTQALNELTALVGTDKIKEQFAPDGFNAELTRDDALRILNNKNVGSIEEALDFKTASDPKLDITRAPGAWARQIADVHLNGSGQTICIVDTGVDFTHPDLANKNAISTNLDCYNGNCIADPSTTDLSGHGTHVAGIAAADGQVQGIAPGAKIISLKVYEGSSEHLSSTIPLIRAINWCVSNAQQYNISVISMSIATDTTYSSACDGFSTTLAGTINNAVSQNIAIVVAAGNNGNSSGIALPACMSNSIPVGATNHDDTVAFFSNYNQLVKLFAPGTAIYSTDLGGSYSYRDGTSMSTPMVSAAIAILNQVKTGEVQQRFALTPQDAESILQANGDPVIGLPSTFSRINIYRAVAQMYPIADLNADSIVNSTDLSLLLGCWGPTSPASDWICRNADITQDGQIGSADLAFVLGGWNQAQ